MVLVAEEGGEAGEIGEAEMCVGAAARAGLAKAVVAEAAGQIGGVETFVAVLVAVGPGRVLEAVGEGEAAEIEAAEMVVGEVAAAVDEEEDYRTAGFAARRLMGLPGYHHRHPADDDNAEGEALHPTLAAAAAAVVALAAGRGGDSFAPTDSPGFAFGSPAGRPFSQCRGYYWMMGLGLSYHSHHVREGDRAHTCVRD